MAWILRFLALCILTPSRLPSWARDLVQEHLALQQQIAVLRRQQPRPRVRNTDRMFWALLCRHWPNWRQACVLVQPATVIGWHRKAWRLAWKWKSRPLGRPPKSQGLRDRVRQIACEDPRWGAPRIHGELLRLGYRTSERTVLRLMPRRPPSPRQRQRWKSFLDNHRELIASMDFLVLPTWNLGQIYLLVILHHGRRMILHVNATRHPSSAWVRQQLREAFPFDQVPKYLLHDRDQIFSGFGPFLASLGITPKPIAFRSPWQNGASERLMGTLRRELLDHVVVFNEAHLMRLMKAFSDYYHADRTHLTLAKDSPISSRGDPHRDEPTAVRSEPRCGGLHHRYFRAA